MLHRPTQLTKTVLVFPRLAKRLPFTIILQQDRNQNPRSLLNHLFHSGPALSIGCIVEKVDVATHESPGEEKKNIT
jgi:hypothetical protein